MTLTHGLRALHDAILVGVGTVLADNPSLTVRLVNGSNPKPIVLDSTMRMPLNAKLLTSEACERPIVLTAAPANADRRRALEDLGAEVLVCSTDPRTGRIDVKEALRILEGRFDSIMVEGGAEVLDSFLRGRHADAALVTVAPTLLPGGLRYGKRPSSVDSSPTRLDLQRPEWFVLGEDAVVIGSLIHN